MASRSTKEPKSGFRILHPSAVLLATAVGSSAIVALVTLQGPSPSNAVFPKDPARAIAQLPGESAPPVPEKRAERTPDPAPQEWSREEMPTLEHVVAKRLAPVAVRLDVALEGIDALLHDFKCPQPYTKVETGRLRSGEVGCGVTKKDGYFVRLGRWVHREANGKLEVGTYQDGLKTGVWETYSTSGMLLERGEYEQGNREGEWNTFGDDGTHLASRNYRTGYFDGAALLFHRHKPIVEIWKMGQLIKEERDFADSQLVFEEDGTVRKADQHVLLSPDESHVPALLSSAREETATR